MTTSRRPDAASIARIERYLEKRGIFWRAGEFEVGGSPGILIALEDLVAMAHYAESQGYGVKRGGQVVKEAADQRARPIFEAVEREIEARRARGEREYGLVTKARRAVARSKGLSEAVVKKAHNRVAGNPDRTTVR